MPCGGAEELLRLGFRMEWSTGGCVVLDLRHVGDVEAQSSEMADVVLRALRGGRRQGPENIQLYLPWNLSEEKKKELGNAGLPQGDDTS